MKFSKDNIYLIAGMGMIVGSFFAASKAVGGGIAILYFATSTDFTNSDNEFLENFANTVNATHVTEAVNGVVSFLILFFGGRWILRGPKLIERWVEFSHTGEYQHSDRSEQAEDSKPDHVPS